MRAAKILIVEEAAPIREMIAFHLGRAGYETFEAGDCRGARAILADERPDLALIDWMLPDMSGLELTRMLKRDGNNDDLAIIMLLHFLMTHPDRVYSRTQLLGRVWGANV